MLKFLRFEVHACVALSKSCWVDLQFCTTVSQKWDCTYNIFSQCRKDWEMNDKVVKQCQIFCCKGLFLPHSLEIFVRWITFSNNQAKTFDVWFTSLTHHVEKTERWITNLTHCVEKFKIEWRKRKTILSHSVVKLEIWLTVLYQSGKKCEKWHTNLTNCVESFVAKKNHNFVSQCGNVCDLNYNLVPQCRKLWEVILNFVS